MHYLGDESSKKHLKGKEKRLEGALSKGQKLKGVLKKRYDIEIEIGLEGMLS